MVDVKKGKKYYRIDKIILEMVNCPFGVKQLIDCLKCPWNLGKEEMYPNNFIKCEVEEVKT